MSEPPTPPPPSSMPMPPISELAASAVQLHELHTVYVDAGFSEEQAFQIVLVLMRSIWNVPR